MKKKRKLAWQIYSSYVLIILVALIAVAFYSSNALKQFYLRNVREELETHAAYFSTLLDGKFAVEYRQEIDALCKTVGEQLDNRFTVILRSGLVIGDSLEDPDRMDNHADRPEIQQAYAGEVGTSTRFSYTLERNMMYVAIPFQKDAAMIGVVRASTPVMAITQTLHTMYAEIAVTGIIVAILAAIVSLFVSYRITRPLEEMRNGAMRFAYGDLSHKILVPESYEIGALAETMNQMASQLEERIQTIIRQRNELEAVLTSMVEAVIMVDEEDRIVRCNHAAGQLFGINPDTCKQRSVQEVIRNASIQRFIIKTFKVPEPIEDVVTVHSGEERFLHAHGTLLSQSADLPPVALLVFHDITRLKQLENMRQEFVANVSHELKTPITAIEGFVETLLDGAISEPENGHKFLKIIERNAHRLKNIINDLLTLSKIEQQEKEEHIVLTEGSIKDVIDTAVQMCETSAQEKNVSLELICEERLRANINRDLLVQAVVNLLDNAIKYSDSRSQVRVRGGQKGADVVISVKDFGPGIPKEHLARLFERFYRIDKARSREIGGTGLGLAIVKHIATAHHGYATVKSTVEKGSTFSIRLPLQ